MSARRPHPIASLLALAVALCGAYAAGVFGASTTTVAALVLCLGVARARGAAFASVFDRPKLFAVLGAGYLLFFLVDLLLAGRTNPVPSLGRLVVFLLAAEVLSGDARRAHRPVLFGLLLLVSGASLTTEFWYAIPLAVFVWTATISQLTQKLYDDTGAAPARSTVSRTASGAAFRLTLASLLAGMLFFLAVPRVGAGWARLGVRNDAEQALETGLAPSVRLGALGRVKVRRTVAFRARVDGRLDDPESLYWRVRSYDRWTGSGWSRSDRAGEVTLSLPAGEEIPVPPGHGGEAPDLVVTLTSVRSDFPAVPVPGRGIWVRSIESGLLLASPDGTLIPAGGRPTRRMEIAVTRPHLGRAADGVLRSADGDFSPATLDVSGVGRAVSDWAESVTTGSRSARDVASALIRDLAQRDYSLDTRRIDPQDALGSFLAGAPAHCEYFATALALGLRTRGIPARVVGGFLGAERSPFGAEWVVRDSRAHLWTEGYFAGSGWVALDGTPAAGLVPPSPFLPWIGSAWDSVVVTWDTWVIGLDMRDQMEALLDLRDWVYGAVVGITRAGGFLAAAVSCLCAAAAFAFYRLRRQGGSCVGVPTSYARFLRVAARAGLVPHRSESAGEFGLRAACALPNAPDVRFLTEVYERERFGGVRADAAESRAVTLALDRLSRDLTNARQRGKRS